MNKRILLVHRKHGIFLGCCDDVVLFSLLDSHRLLQAITFPTPEVATNIISNWEPKQELSEFEFVSVSCDNGNFITAIGLYRAGLKHLMGDLFDNLLRFAVPAGRA